jgi:hypothetical protein
MFQRETCLGASAASDIVAAAQPSVLASDEWLCARSWLARHPAKIKISRSSGRSSHHTIFYFFAKIMFFSIFFAKIMIFLDHGCCGET